MAVLEFIEVTQIFGTRDNPTNALRAVSLQIEPRQVVVIMGPSGAGKSTLLSIGGGLLRPTAGRILVDGTEITGMNDTKLADVRLRTVGFVFQDFNLFDALTVMQNLELVATRAGVPKKNARARAEELLRILGMEHRMKYHPRMLSGGEVMSMLKMVAHDMGKAVLMVSHDHRTLEYADRVVWLQDGLLEDREPASMASMAQPGQHA